MMACVYAAAFGAIQQMPRIVPGLAEVRALPRTAQEQTISGVQSFQEFGGLAGRLLLAFLAARHHQPAPAAVCVSDSRACSAAARVSSSRRRSASRWRNGAFSSSAWRPIAQFSFWGNYLPRVYPTHLRGTGESFAANVGGRMIGTFAALVDRAARTVMPGASVPIKLAYACALVGTVAYVIGFVASFWLPEPKQASYRTSQR